MIEFIVCIVSTRSKLKQFSCSFAVFGTDLPDLCVQRKHQCVGQLLQSASKTFGCVICNLANITFGVTGTGKKIIKN